VTELDGTTQESRDSASSARKSPGELAGGRSSGQAERGSVSTRRSFTGVFFGEVV